MDKINFLYNESAILGSGYMCTRGLREEFNKQGTLNYAFDSFGGEFLDKEKFQESPIFYIRGFLQGRMPYIEAGGNQFKSTLQSESFYTRHGKMDVSSTMIREREKYFGLFITFAESDTNIYSVPTVWMPSWADVTVLNDVAPPESDKLAFIGGISGREDWLNKDKHKIIHHQQSQLHKDPFINAQRYSQLMNKFKILVAPPGRMFNSMTGRVFEIMACRRLCLAYVNPDTMFKHMELFVDGEDYVTWTTFDEMVDKYKFYIERPDELWRIATNGYNKVRQYNNQELAAQFIYEQTINASQGIKVGSSMRIEERMVRRNQEDIIEIGSALETFYDSPAGTIVRAMVNAITTRQFIEIEDNRISADRKLGRAEGLSILITDIELAIDDMKRLTVELKEDQRLEE